MWLNLPLLLIISTFCSTVYSSLLVQLNTNTTLLRFLRSYPDINDRITKTFSFGTFNGFAGNFDASLIKLLVGNPLVQKVSPDVPVQMVQFDVNKTDGSSNTRESSSEGTNEDTSEDDDEPEIYQQQDAPRHLWRVSQRQGLNDENSSTYYYTTKGEENIDVYVIDTGIYSEHPDFEGRVQQGIDFTQEGFGDTNGHGTHVAGLIGSKTYGSAKNVNMIEVKVLTGLGTGNLSAVIAGIDYAVNNRRMTGRKSLANLSLGAGFNSLLNSAVNAAVGSGLPMVVAAGNANTAACASSPASSINALTVGAIDDRYDTIASFSNWGSCVDLFASGVYVTSLSHIGDTGTLALSGTSMAAPVVAGMMAMYMGTGSDEKEAIKKILDLATVDVIERRSVLFRPRTPNKVAYTGLNYGQEEEEDDGGGGGGDNNNYNNNINEKERGIEKGIENINDKFPDKLPGSGSRGTRRRLKKLFDHLDETDQG